MSHHRPTGGGGGRSPRKHGGGVHGPIALGSAGDTLVPLLAALPVEGMLCFHLDRGDRVIGIDSLSDGHSDHTTVALRHSIGRAIDLETDGIVLVHNHPSGDPRPSAADITATRRMAALFETIGVRLIDHRIVARDGSFSLRQSGLI